MLRELHRITRQGGLIAVFEHNPLNPLTVHAVNTCSFDANAKLILARDLARRLRAAGWARNMSRLPGNPRSWWPMPNLTRDV